LQRPAFRLKAQPMSRNPERPLSPHLTIWKWGPHMAVSILHRVTGGALATVGVIAMVWWLLAAAGSPEGYATFTKWATSWLGIVVGVGLLWAFFQHTLSAFAISSSTSAPASSCAPTRCGRTSCWPERWC
jgi:succinate dehydrogenase cytochrome b556 subunit